MQIHTQSWKGYFHRRSLVQQVTFIVFISGLVMSSLISMGQLYFEYQNGEKMAIQEIDEMVRVFIPQIETAVWQVDKNSLNRLSDALARDPSIADVEVTDTGFGSVWRGSSLKKADWQNLSYPLSYSEKDQTHSIGTLRVALTKAEFLSGFREKVFMVFLQNIFCFLTLATAMAWFFHKKIAAPILSIQEMTHRYSESQLKSMAGYSIPTHYGTNNEIEILKWDIEQLQINFQSAFEQQKQSEQQARKSEIQLEKEQQKMKMMQRLDSIGQITTQVVHDFGNLMMIIQGKATVLDRHLQEPAQKKYTEDIRKSVFKAQNLVSKLLKMTRFQDVDKTIIEPMAMIADLQDLLKTAVGSQIILSTPTEETKKFLGRLTTEVDPSSLENALLNLCVNARDAMPNGGEIQIQVACVHKDQKAYIAISVMDTGTGIPKEIQDKIFDPFFTTKSAGKGSGLGLHQVQEFVKESGGWLELVTSPTGSKFTLFLPEFKDDIERQAA